jgi:hypothetical protein
MGDLFFKYLPAKKQFSLYDCNGKPMNYFSEMDTQNRVWNFKQYIEPIESNNFLQDIIDTIKNNLPTIDL